MAQKEPKDWITVNGKHVPIYDGESKQDAYNRAVAKQNEETKTKQIKESNTKQKEFNESKFKSSIEGAKNDAQVRKLIKDAGYKIKKDESDDFGGALSVWLDDTTRIYKSSRGYKLQKWQKVNWKPSNIPTFDPSWQDKTGRWKPKK